MDNELKKCKEASYKLEKLSDEEGRNSKSYKVNVTNKYAVVMGNEGNGVKEEILDLCDDYLYIDISDKVESLNVGVATSIILY